MADAAPDIVEILTTIPLLADLPAHAIADLASDAEWRHLEANSYLFRQGDAAGDLAIVWTGRLEVLNEDDATPTLAGVLNRGAWVGELALLTGQPRSASIRATRDSQLLMIPRAAFDRVLDREPDLGLALARTLAAQLQRTRGISPRSPRPDTIAVVALTESLPLQTVVDAILAAARVHGRAVALDEHSVASTDPATSDDWVAALDRAEAETDLVVLVSREPEAHPDWCAFCCRSADRSVALLRGGKPPAWAVDLLHGRADLVFVGSSLLAARIGPGLAALAPRAHHHLPEGSAGAGAAARLARRVTGHAIGVVLSGGGARGLAHLGAIAQLVDDGVPIDRIGGCSAGALVAGLHAMGLAPAEAAALARRELVDHHPFADVTVPRESLIKGRRAMAMLTRMFGDARIEELSLPVFTVSADLNTGDLITHDHGRLRDAVAASMAIPGFVPAFRMGARLHVDGGLLDNFPVDVMKDADEGPVIGIDVMRDFGSTAEPSGGSTPGIVTTIARAVVLGGWQRSERNRRIADVLVTPEVDGIGLFEFEQMDQAIAAGRRAAVEAIPEIRRLLDPSSGAP